MAGCGTSGTPALSSRVDTAKGSLVDDAICLVCLLGAFDDLGSRRVVFLPPGLQD